MVKFQGKPDEGTAQPQSLRLMHALIAYEDAATRNRALQLSHRLPNQHELIFSWWRFDFLSDPHLSRAAAQAARTAEMILFFVRTRQELPPGVRQWIDRWQDHRRNTKGLLGAWIEPIPGSLEGISPVQVYLRQVAQRAGMDYLPGKIEFSVTEVPYSMETISQRANTTTAVLKDILLPKNSESHFRL